MTLAEDSLPGERSQAPLELLCREITVVANQLKKAAFRFEGDDLFLAVGRDLLAALAEHGPLTVPALAALRSSSRQNVQIMVNRLARLGCVEMRPNPDHKKSSLISLTGTGRDALAKAAREERAFLRSLESAGTAREIRAGFELLARLRKALEADEAGRLRRTNAAPHPTGEAPPNLRPGFAHQPLPDAAKAEEPEQTVPTEDVEDDSSLPYNLL